MRGRGNTLGKYPGDDRPERDWPRSYTTDVRLARRRRTLCERTGRVKWAGEGGKEKRGKKIKTGRESTPPATVYANGLTAGHAILRVSALNAYYIVCTPHVLRSAHQPRYIRVSGVNRVNVRYLELNSRFLHWHFCTTKQGLAKALLRHNNNTAIRNARPLRDSNTNRTQFKSYRVGSIFFFEIGLITRDLCPTAVRLNCNWRYTVRTRTDCT